VNQYLSEMTADGSERENSTEHTDGRQNVRDSPRPFSMLHSHYECLDNGQAHIEQFRPDALPGAICDSYGYQLDSNPHLSW